LPAAKQHSKAASSDFVAVADSKVELAKLQMRLAQQEFDAQQRRLDAEEVRKQTEFEERARMAAADEERRIKIFLLETKILEARLSKMN
jgi:hypothetical protein